MTLNPRDMDGFMPLLSTSDIKTKMIIGNNLLTYLGDLNNSIECQDIGLFIDNVIPWLNNGNAKIVQNGLEILTQIADRMGHDFKPYISSIIQPTIDRLGDSKDLTREKARLVLLKILEKGSMVPQQLLDRIHPAFSHKNAKLREEALLLLTTILAEHGADLLSLSSLIPSIVKLLSDPNEKVRETAVNTVVNIYRHVGERFRNDLQRNHNLPAAKWQLLVEKFDQVRAEGDLFPHANAMDAVGRDTDELDRAVRSAPAKKIKSVLPKKSQFGPSSKIPPIGSASAGAVDEESFLTAFEDVPQVHLFSAKDLEEHFKSIRDTIGDDKKDWNQRIDQLKKLRAIVMAGGASYENFMDLLKSLQNPYEGACTDLRSQVVKEATITLAYLSRQLKNKIAHFIEGLLGSVMNLIQNSAKVVSSSGAVALRFIFQHTHSPRFIPILTAFFTSKSKDIRRAACEYVSLILQTWSTQLLQKHIKTLQDAIGKGIGDPDAEARVFARKAYWAFRDHFPEQAEALLKSMDASHKRNLLSQSNSGSVNSLNAVTRTPSIPPRSTRPTMSAAGSTENLHQTQSPPYGPLKRTPSLPRSYRQSGIPVLQRPTDNYCRVSPGPRSNSAIDLQAARRAQSRLKYASINRTKATTSRPAAKVETNFFTSPERSARTKTRVSGVSQSQPSSRSCSPASRMSYASYNREGESFIARPRRLSGQGMRSNETSRDPSPQRFGLDRSVSSKLRERNLYMSPRPPVMAQKMLQQSQAAESALADALTFDRDHLPKTPRSKGDHSDDSETSSICSERSMENFRRPSDSFSWSGSQQRLYRDTWDTSGPKDIKEIIEWCGRKQWGERKEGLMDLQQFLMNGNTLTATELRQITDIFTKMFMDSHTKVFSLFLDTLNELIASHSEDLVDWLYVLCTRLLNKLGMDLLVSIQTKINRSLDVVREYFPSEQLLPVVMRFLTDPAHTPNSRVKVATLTFLTHITENAEPSSLTPSCKSALVRLLDWTNDVKSQEVRRHAQEAIIALYNLNPPLFPMMLNELPKMYQDIAMPLIQNHLKRSPASNPASPSGQIPRVPQSPARILRHDLESDDHLNPEEVYKSLRRTTAEIQNYGFERMEGATSSKDSGISNMADVEEKIESLTLSNSGRSSSVSSPTQRGRSVNSIAVNGSSDTIAGDLILPDRRNNGYEGHNSGVSPELPRGPEVFERTLILLQSPETHTVDKANVLRDFQLYIREGDGAKYVITQFKKLLKTMLDCLALDDKSLEIEVLKTLIEMLKCRDLTNYFDDFADLLILKVLNEHKSEAYEGSSSSPRRGHSSAQCAKPLQLLKAAEDCAAMIAAVLPAHKTIHLALTTAKTEPFPKNVAAIKMIQNVVEHRGKEALGAQIDDVMGTLMQAYENPESVVRKAAVFCMVAIHAAIGEEAFNKYRKNLYGGKLKLLNIYIQKAQEAVQSSSSPRSNHSKN
ncbi:CLIP-associating protein 1-A isoform X3 [Microplitis demolitor]|uniref:CLIP-associating protein 1-A isoform X3 n=1 Tax=Microplitis demolitor TaxID=69319 RepID=UPI00235B7021|nr:CLIP-associating protein 1-A isoform X3 [Microplitis demolitor]